MDGEFPSIFEEKYPIARKEHKCCECHKAINAGEKYHFFKGCWDGKWARYKTCIPCNDTRQWFVGLDMVPPFENLSDFAIEEGINIFNR